MVATISQLIGKINPKLYASNGDELLKEYGSVDKIPAEKVKAQALKLTDGDINPKNGVSIEHTLTYESYTETLEPVYYFIIDLMNDFGHSPEKLIDNFTGTPGSNQSSELMLKASRMIDEASKIMQTVGILTKSILQIVYDLRDFKIRLKTYDILKSSKKEEREAALLSLKQIWLDKVDILKGGSAIKVLYGQVGFQTLFDAFMISKDEKDVDKLDLNDRIKRTLKPRIQEFNIWVKSSETELRKRYEMQRVYLKSQVNSLKLYSRWAKPYLKAAQDLQQKDQGRNPSIVNTFNRVVLELTLLGKSQIRVDESALEGSLPSDFYKSKSLQGKRKYYSCVLVDFIFTAIPTQGNYIGRVEVTFRGYALNEDEIKKLDEELGKSDIGDAISAIEGITGENLELLQDEIDNYMNEKDESTSEKPKSKDTSNPFLALIGYYDKEDKKDSKDKSKSNSKKEIVIKPDDWIEREHIRKLAGTKAEKVTFNIFDIYKKSHGMVSYT